LIEFDDAIEANIGKIVLLVAVFEVISVRNVIIKDIDADSNILSDPFKRWNCCPIYSDSPDVENPFASANPPPKIRTTSHGIFLIIVSSSNLLDLSFFDGIKNNSSDENIAIVPSSIYFPVLSKSAQPLILTNPKSIPARVSHNSAVVTNIANTAFSS